MSAKGANGVGHFFYIDVRLAAKRSRGVQKNRDFRHFSAILTRMTWTLLSSVGRRTLHHRLWALPGSDYAWKAFVLKVAFFFLFLSRFHETIWREKTFHFDSLFNTFESLQVDNLDIHLVQLMFLCRMTLYYLISMVLWLVEQQKNVFESLRV